jgi:TP901 family phage tail tape measure protein
MAGRTVTATLALNAQNYIAGMNRAAAATRDFATKANAAVGKNKVSIERLGKASGLIGAGLAVGVVAAVKSAADFDSAMSSVAATGADAKNNLVALRQAAIQAGADTKFSATEAAGGLESLAKAGVSSKDALGGGLKGALDLAAAGNLNVSDSAEVAATAMTQFGLAGSQVPHIADLLAAGAGKAQGEVSDMAQALNQSGLVAAQFGLSIEDTTGTLAAFANAGLVGSDAGTSFKTMLQRLANPSAQASDAMKKLGINAYDAQGNFVGITSLADQLKNKLGPLTQAQRNAALATIFGSDAIRSASILYEQGASGIQTWIDNVNQTGYASDVAATKMDNLKGDLEQLRGSFETALIGLGEGANGPLRSLVQSITDAVNSFNTLGDGTKSAVLAVGGIGAGALLGVAGVAKLAVGTSEAIGAFRSLAASAPRLASALRTVGAAGWSRSRVSRLFAGSARSTTTSRASSPPTSSWLVPHWSTSARRAATSTSTTCSSTTRAATRDLRRWPTM